MQLLLLADPSRSKVEAYLKEGECFQAISRWTKTWGLCIEKGREQVRNRINEYLDSGALSE